MVEDHRDDRPLRILTIDNGGLQALSILSMLEQVCNQVSEPNRRDPHELFDVIAGIGTGGWLAILLGRYKLSIGDCMGIYFSIANAICPQKNCGEKSTKPTAISQQRLIAAVERILNEKKLSKTLVDEEAEKPENQHGRRCFAFAIGVVPSEPPASNTYHLFRTYKARSPAPRDPDLGDCLMTQVCAATAAAQDFLPECRMGDFTYYDSGFPNTHNISRLALEEAQRIFGHDRSLSAIVSIAPGLPSERQIKRLRRAARHNGTKRYWVKNRAKRALDFLSPSSPRSPILRPRSADIPNLDQPLEKTASRRLSTSSLVTSISRSDTSSSASSVSSQISVLEGKWQEAIRIMLESQYGSREIYHRFALPKTTSSETVGLYLDDIHDLDLVRKLVNGYMTESETKQRLEHLQKNWTNGRKYRTDPDDLPRSSSPRPDDERFMTSSQEISVHS